MNLYRHSFGPPIMVRPYLIHIYANAHRLRIYQPLIAWPGGMQSYQCGAEVEVDTTYSHILKYWL